jgi:hypothetical protein
MIYQSVIDRSCKGKMLALLIDPDETGSDKLKLLLGNASSAGVSFILVAGEAW